MKRSQPMFALLATCLFACATTPAHDDSASSSASTRDEHKPLLPAPKGALDLSAVQGATVSLDEMLRRLSKVTGVTFSPSGAVGDRLKQTNIELSQDKHIPAAEIYPWVESILQQNGYSLAVLEGGDAPLVGVYSTKVPGQSPPAIRIDADQIEECRAHPAFLFNVVITLPNTDVRALGNSLRMLSTDAPSGGVVPVGLTHSVILNGSGRQVADLAAMLQTIDAKAASGPTMPKDS